MNRVLLSVVAGCVWVPVCSAQFSSSRPLQSLESRLLYHPRTAAESWLELPPQIHVEDVWLRSTDGQLIHAWWLPHPQSAGIFCFAMAMRAT